MKNIKKWLAAAGAGLAVIAGTAVALPTSTISAASAQHGAGPGGQTDTYLADALGITVDELTSSTPHPARLPSTRRSQTAS